MLSRRNLTVLPSAVTCHSGFAAPMIFLLNDLMVATEIFALLFKESKKYSELVI